MKLRWISALALPVVSGFLLPSFAQGPRARLAGPIDPSQRVSRPGSSPAFVIQGKDQGALPPSTELRRITLVFNRTAAQQTELDALLAAQQDTASPLYHHWLSPEEFATRFGMADADLTRVQAWLQSQGFVVDSVARSRNAISFNGTEAQVAAAFGTELHRYNVNGKERFGPAADLTLPANLSPLVLAVLHLSDLHPHAHVQRGVRPRLTSGSTGNEFLTPGDVATMYDVKPVYQAGFNGTGQSIAVLGQSFVDTSAVAAFQSGANLTANLPSLVLVPQTGVPGVNPMEDGDEEESQIDLEYAAGMAPGAKIYLVYTGDSLNSNGVFDSLSYAIDQDLAPIVSGSYGVCETALQTQNGAPSQDALTMQSEVQQANAQGQTVIFSAGDDGSTDCYGITSFSAAQQGALAVDFPGSIPYVTSVGGLQMQAGTYFKSGATTGTGTSTQYWQSATGTDVISSLLSYVPETIWNESTVGSSGLSLSSGGGGTSVLFARPSWQAGVAGIPSGTQRLVPDLSLQASTGSPGYAFCTTDPSALAGYDEPATCTNGLRSADGTFTPAGGTSFAAPIMAGMLAVLNQAKGEIGQGNLNKTLYGLAANSATYAAAFHDVTAGNNACPTGATACASNALTSYAAGTGYDEASGLGSIDFAKLVSAWPVPSGASVTALGSVTTVTAATLTPSSAASDAITISVAGARSGATPTGTISLQVDGSSTPTTLTLNNGAATYTYTGTTVSGSHSIVATYSGDGNYLPSTGTVVLTLAGSTTIPGSFTLTGTGISVPYNGMGTGTLTITPAAGYTGTVSFSLSVPSSAPTICYATTATTQGGSNVSANQTSGPITATLTLYEGTKCGTASTSGPRPGNGFLRNRGGVLPLQGADWPEGVALAGLFVVPFALLRRGRKVPTLLGIAILSSAGIVLSMGLSGCGGSGGNTLNNGGTTTTPTNQAQTFSITVIGTDTVNSSLTSSATVSVNVHP